MDTNMIMAFGAISSMARQGGNATLAQGPKTILWS